MTHFHEGAGVGVEDSVEDFPGESSLHCLMCSELVPCDVCMDVYTREESLLLHGSHLRAAARVERRSIVVEMGLDCSEAL
jgi:hypothetical protein